MLYVLLKYLFSYKHTLHTHTQYTKESYHGAVNYLQHTRSLINETAQEYEPVTLIFVTVISVLALQRIINFLWNEDESKSWCSLWSILSFFLLSIFLYLFFFFYSFSFSFI